MKRIAIPAAVIASTCLALALLFAIRPFRLVNLALDRLFGALPEWTQVENMRRDPATQEVSHGDHPIQSFRFLQSSWAAHPGATRIVLMGNSQSLMTSLAPGEPPPAAPEKTYTDWIADFYRRNGDRRLFYRLSAGALSYEEMLWYTAYLVLHPEIKPDVLLIQLNYQNFANSGIRAGMLELLSSRDFRARMESLSASRQPYSGSLAEAIHRYDDATRAKERTNDAPPPPPGYGLETAVRLELDRIPGFKRRDAFKSDFIYMLYRCRTYLLRLQPATRRSLGGPRIQASRAALESTVALAGSSGIRVILFEAPTNPAVPLYRTAEDARDYHAFTDSLASRYHIPLFDFERSIPQNLWGMSLNVPDPLHLGREAHRRFAALMIARLEEGGF